MYFHKVRNTSKLHYFMVEIKLHTSMIDMNVKYMYGAIQQKKFERAYLESLTS